MAGLLRHSQRKRGDTDRPDLPPLALGLDSTRSAEGTLAEPALIVPMPDPLTRLQAALADGTGSSASWGAAAWARSTSPGMGPARGKPPTDGPKVQVPPPTPNPRAHA